MKVLAIDPGFERLGVSVIEKNPREELLFSACIKTHKSSSFEERLFALAKEVENIINKYRPEHLAIENLFMSNNQKTVMRVSEVRGMIIYIAMSKGLKVFEYTPLQIKTAITGYGKSDKSQVEFMVRKLIKMNSENKIDDEMDAIACGLTHFAYYKVI